MTPPNDFNAGIIKEFRENEGRVGGPFKGAPVLLLHHKGAKSGTERINPLVYLEDGERLLVFASKGGSPTNPDWFYNLRANPDATVEVGTEEFAVEAEAMTGEERDRLFAKQVEISPTFGQYEARTGGRKIPVVALKRKG